LSGAPSGEAARSLYGAWRLVMGDTAAMRHFDGTSGAAIRSFWAAAIGAPMYAVTLIYGPGAGPFTDVERAVVVHLIGYVTAWCAYPLAMAYVASALGFWPRYFRFVAAYNWAAIIQYAAMLLATLLAALLPAKTGAMVLLAAMVFALVYEWYVARVALEIPPLTAAGVVGLDVALSLLINAVTARLS
jgi:hypothetical protein